MKLLNFINRKKRPVNISRSKQLALAVALLVSLVPIGYGLYHVTASIYTKHFGWWLNEGYWGGGRAQEALNLITKTYFRLKPKETSYIAHVRLWNKRGYQALKKGGFEDVGYFYEEGKAARHILEMKRK